jgi:CRP-like cAMP-binding protein
MYQNWSGVLIKIDLFDNMNENELLTMLSCLKPSLKEYKKNEIAAMEGHEQKGIGIVLSGSMIVTKESFDGSRIIMKKISQGGMFGEIAAFSKGGVWPATVVAQQDSVVMYMPHDKILGNCNNMCMSHTTLMYNMLKIVSNKAIDLNKRIEYLSVKSIREKICKFLLDQYHLQKSTTLYLDMNRNEMADFLNITRPSLSREMGFMKDEGLIDYYRASIKILKLDEISKYLN